MPDTRSDLLAQIYLGTITKHRLYGEVRVAERQLNVLVTGGAGFVGSHLVDRLMLEGHRVTVIDNLSTGSLANIGHWSEHQNFKFVQHDVRLPFRLNDTYDQVYHLACQASPKHYQADQRGTIKTCFFGTLNALTLASQCGARLVFASTSEVYGDPLEHPQSEKYLGNVSTMGPRACYDEGKRAAETLCYTYSGDIDVRIARVFNTYGPRMATDDGRAVSEFVNRALRGQSLVIQGDGSQTRSFQYIDDLVNGLIALMSVQRACPFQHPFAVNLGNPEELTIKELAGMVIRLTGSQSTVKHGEAAACDPKRRKPDITVANELLNWNPSVQLEEGLALTIEYFRSTL